MTLDPSDVAGAGTVGHASAGHGTSAPDACSVRFDEDDVSAFGTAAKAGFWLAVEQSGPWGREAATSSHLPADIGRRLADECASRGGRLSLLRAPGPHSDTEHVAGRTAYLAFSGPRPWLLATHGASVADLLAADLDALAAGDLAATRASLPGSRECPPVLLVCTNGRRDVCCALRGRPVALDAAAGSPGRVWEASHTGGHRFAPTGVLLPFGATLARLDADLCGQTLKAADDARLPLGMLGSRHDRGRSPLAPSAQAAESFVREQLGETSLTALAARPLDGPGDGQERHAVEHADGRAWTVTCERVGRADPRPESCGKAPVPTLEWVVRLEPAPAAPESSPRASAGPAA